MVIKFGEKSQMGKDRLMLQILERINEYDKCTLLIIDKAHLIAPQTLTDLRLLIFSIDANLYTKKIGPFSKAHLIEKPMPTCQFIVSGCNTF